MAAETTPPTPIEEVTLTLGSIRRRLLRGSAWVLGGKVLTIFLGLVINMLLARLLDPEELGAYFTTFTMMMIGSTIAQLGLDRAVVRLVAAAIATSQPGRARHVVRRVFIAGAAGASLVALVLILGVGSWLARNVFHSALVEGLIPLTAGWIVVVALQSLCVETFRGLQGFAAATIFDALLVDFIMVTVFGALYVAGVNTNVHVIVALSVAITAVVAIFAGARLRARVRGLTGEGLLARWEAFGIAWPLLVTSISIYLLGTGVDLLVLGAFRTQVDVALYGAAARLTLMVAAPFMILQGVTPPIVAELHAQGKKQELERSARAVATLAGIPTFLILVVFLLFGKPILGVLYGDFYRQGASVLAVLSLARLVAVWTGSGGVALMMTGHQRAMMYLTVGTGILSMLGGIFAAAQFGSIGVAVATSSAQIVQNLLQLVLAKRLVGVWTHVYVSPRPFIQYFFGHERSAV